MSTAQPCARWGCDQSATYNKPLCYSHWREWENWDLEECSRCHWLYGANDAVVYDGEGWEKELPFHCDDCLGATLNEQGRGEDWTGRRPQHRPVLAHAALRHAVRYVYILKLSDGTFHIGQTTDLAIRVREHKEGLQTSTRGKDPRLVYYGYFVASRDAADRRERQLTLLNESGPGRRKLRRLIERFRTPISLVDLSA